MNRTLLAVALTALFTLSIAGCKPEAPAEPPAVAVAPAPSAPPIESVAAASDSTPSGAALDQKGFAGRFAGGGTKITLTNDGTFELAQGKSAFDGTWTAESGGARIRLDPNSKAEPDRLFAVASQDEIRPLNEAGEAVEGGSALQREE